MRRTVCHKMKKAPETGASEWKLAFAPSQGRPKLLLLLRSSFFLRGSFLCCALHRLILPNIKFCDSKKSQCDSYIRLFGNKVKKKMQSHCILRANSGLNRC